MLLEKLRQLLIHPLLASQSFRCISLVHVASEELTSSALNAVNVQIDWSTGEDASEAQFA